MYNEKIGNKSTILGFIAFAYAVYSTTRVIPRSTSQYTRQAKNVPTAQTQVSRASRIKVHFGGICVPESEKERQWTETCAL